MPKKNKPIKLSEILKNINKKSIQDNAAKEREQSYDIRNIFEQMELDLISSMHKAFYFHKREEAKEGFSWEQWQKSKLRAIEEYRKRNKKLVDSYSRLIQEAIDRELNGGFKKSVNNIVKRVKKFFGISLPDDISESQKIKEYIKAITGQKIETLTEESFFGVNKKKLNVLQEVVEKDLKKAQYSVLRRMDDVYRQTIYKSQVYMQSGATSLNKAIDMATKDFLNKGINSIKYKDGKSVNIASYAEMCLRTANHRAKLLGEGSKRDEWRVHLVVVSAHANTCKMCEPWQGKVLIDDVFSHPSKEYMEQYSKKYELLSKAIKAGLIHVNCRHNLVTYFEGITNLPKVPDTEEALKTYEAEQKQRALERQIRKWKRFEAGTCDEESKQIASNKLKQLQKDLRNHLNNNKELRRNTNREKLIDGLEVNNSKIESEVLKQKELNDKIKETREYIRTNQHLGIKIGTQGKHILGHNNYIEGRSYLTISLEEAQELVNKYAGTGYVNFNRKGEWDKKELIKGEKDIGVSINNKTGIETPTNKFKIHYSNKGTHIVPTLKEE